MFDVVCAGHLCLDFTPSFMDTGETIGTILTPGRLTEVGSLNTTLGGMVGNTGLAFQKMGFEVALMARVGNDPVGEMTMAEMIRNDGATDYLSIDPNEESSYSMIVAIPGHDRIIFHDPGANNRFTKADVNYDIVRESRLFHFAYPQIMRSMHVDDGRELEAIMRSAKECGVTTSLDAAFPSEEAKDADWAKIYERVLPYTDIFVPSIEEMLMLLEPETYARLRALDPDILENLDIDELQPVAQRFLDMGASIVVLKCGTLGYYAKTASLERIESIGRAAPADPTAWANKEVFSGIFTVDDVKSATGAGDTSIAGFLGALLRGLSLEQAVTMACAAGGLCVSDYGAVDALLPFEQIQQKVASGWKKRPVAYGGTRLCYSEEEQLHKAPAPDGSSHLRN